MPLVGAMVVGQIGSGLLGASAMRDAAQQAGDAQKAAMVALFTKLDAVGQPPDQSAKVILQQYQQAGLLTPEMEQQVKDTASQYSQIKTGGMTRDMQVQALQQMSQMGRAGFTPEERAVQMQQQVAAQRDNQANQQSIIQNMQARGQGGGGAELAARLGASQGSADQSSMQAAQLSGQAGQRALQAIAQGGQMAGNLNQQDFSQAATMASAQDQMQRFNVQNQMAIGQRNVASANQAQAGNLANQQSIMNTNTGAYNQEQYNQLQRQRQNWQDKLAYASAYGAPMQAYGQAGANQAQQTGQANAGMFAGMAGALGSGVNFYAGQQNQAANLAAYKDRTKAMNGTSTDP